MDTSRSEAVAPNIVDRRDASRLRRIRDRVRRALARDGSPSSAIVAKGLRYAAERLVAPIALRDCDVVGPRARTRGAPCVRNRGRIELGARVNLRSDLAPLELVAEPGGTLHLGDDVVANFGCRFSARARVRIGARSMFGPYCILDDADDDGSAPIDIGDDVWLGAHVTVKKGARIGSGSIIAAGSVVEGEIPPGVFAGGSPARVVRALHRDVMPAAPPSTASCDVKTPPAPKPADVHGVLLADFVVEELGRALARDDRLGPSVDAFAAPFAQIVQTLAELPRIAAERPLEFALVWARPQALPSFADLEAGRPTKLDALLADVDAHAARIVAAATALPKVSFLVASFALPSFVRGLGMLDLTEGGLANALLRMNVRLVEQLAAARNVHVLDAERWLASAGESAWSNKAWYTGKIGFGAKVFELAAADVRAALRGLRGAARKLVVLDLDDTLWGGIVGDVGWENLHLGGHDPLGEAYVDFQIGLKALAARGVLLAVVSKNTESVALEAMRNHPAMVLKPEDFAAYRINWRDKAQNLAELVAELNLGLQSVVFIDDNPVERARVRESFPEVFVPEWPDDKTLYRRALEQLRCFDVPTLSAEDANRTKLYASEREREALREALGSVDAWLRGLDMHVQLSPLSASNLARTAQLLNKTNQMNLTTRRLSEAELLAWSKEPGHQVWTASVSDRLGDAGLTGILSLDRDGDRVRIVDYVLSCRVMGRKVEETLLAAAVALARAAGAHELEAKLVPTAKNAPCKTFFDGSGMTTEGEVHRWSLDRPYPFPDAIHVEGLALAQEEKPIAKPAARTAEVAHV